MLYNFKCPKEIKSYCIYKHTALNGKIYIGLTCQRPEKRWDNGNGYRRSKYFYTAIEKYGWNNFTHEILFSGLSKEEAESKEIELIAFYKSNQREFGYNIDNGGKAKGRCSEETKQLISQIQKGRKQKPETIQKRINSKIGYHHSEETKAKIGNSNRNKIRSTELRKRISEEQKGKKLSKEQKEKISISVKNSWTSERKNEYSKRMKGFNNINFEKKFTEEEIKNLQEKCRGKNSILSKKVGQFDLDGNLIKVYDSAREAGRNGFTVQSITAVCRREKHTHKNYIWKYIKGE